MATEAANTASPVSASRSPWKVISAILAFALAGVLLYFSLRKIEWHDVWRTASSVRPGYLVLVSALGSAAMFLRSFRWRVLLQAEAPVGVAIAFWSTAAGYFGNNFLPARGGELVRTYMIGRTTGMSNAFVLATALSERVADAIVLVVISSAVLLGIPQQPGWIATAGKPFAILGLTGALTIAVLPLLESRVKSILDGLPIPAAFREKLAPVIEHALRGIRAFHDPRRLLAFFGWTILIWCMDAIGVVIGCASLGLAISVPVAFLLIAGLGLGSALPSTPGYVGIYQFVAVSVLTPFGFRAADAIAYILVLQALQYVMIGLWGALGFWQYRRIGKSVGRR